MDLTKSFVLSSSFQSVSAVDRIAVVLDISLYHARCQYKKAERNLKSAILKMAAVLFVCLVCSVHQ